MPDTPSTKHGIARPANTDFINSWPATMRSAIDTIDTLIATAITTMPRPAASVFGRIHRATDGTISFDTGSAWVEIAQATLAPRFASGTLASRPATPTDRTFYLASDQTGQPDELTFYTTQSGWQRIPMGAVGTTEIVDGAVTGAKIANGVVTGAKIETQQAWQSTPMSNGMTGDLYYFKDSLGMVHIRGGHSLTLPANLAHLTQIGTMPVGYRPEVDLHGPLVILSSGQYSLTTWGISAAGAIVFEGVRSGSSIAAAAPVMQSYRAA